VFVSTNDSDQKNYIFYRIELDEIRIVRVLSELQDDMKQLFGISSELE
jgi:plasmid stabilization system protein ParE